MKDIIIHIAIALAIVALAAVFTPWAWPVAAIVSVAFVAREAAQARQKYGRWLWPWQWSVQKLLEAAGPIVGAMIVAGIWSATV